MLILNHRIVAYRFRHLPSLISIIALTCNACTCLLLLSFIHSFLAVAIINVVVVHRLLAFFVLLLLLLIFFLLLFRFRRLVLRCLRCCCSCLIWPVGISFFETQRILLIQIESDYEKFAAPLSLSLSPNEANEWTNYIPALKSSIFHLKR